MVYQLVLIYSGVGYTFYVLDHVSTNFVFVFILDQNSIEIVRIT